MSVISVIFKKDGKEYYFENNDIELNKDDYVIVETEKGIQLGTVVNDTVNADNIDYELKPVIRKATKKDYNTYLDNLKDATIVCEDTKKKVIKDNIPMRIVDANFTFDKKQLTINFVADERVDFRELVKYLASKYKTHIELHQIGVRDKAREIGGIGLCGLTLCCKRFKGDIKGISINMAKNQNISLNPSNINGACGRLLCCLQYEDETYTQIREELPKVGDEIKVEKEKGIVKSIDVINKKITVTINDEDKVVDYSDK